MPQRRRDTLPKTHRRVPGQSGPTAGQQRRISRREREERQRRRLYWGVGIAAALALVVLVGSALNEYWFKPNHVLASVNGVDIKRRDYWKYRAVDLADQANQYASISQSPFVDESQRQQYLALAQQANEQIDDVWGSTDHDDATLQKMVDDQVYLQSLDEFGISISEEDIDNYIDSRFEAPDAPIFTPTPTQTLIPERAEWATQTVVAAEQAEATPVADQGSPIASPEGFASSAGSPLPGATPVAQEELASTAVETPELASPVVDVRAASPVDESAASPAVVNVDGSPVGPTATATTELTPTPNQDQARQTAVANYGDYREAIFGRAHLSRSDYIRLIVRPALAREKIDAQVTADVGQRAEQVHASHILVDTKDLADSIYADITQGGADFAQAARDQSVDSGTAPNGGDLGWFTRGQMVDAFEQAAFDTPPGQISAPIQTQFGWHIIQVFDHVQDRPMTDDQISQMRKTLVEDWLLARKTELDIDSEIEPTPTSSAPEDFVPPPDAPPVPTPTEVPTEVPAVASPATDFASPVAAEVTPVASPVGLASPVSAVVASPSP